jgi:hypothetical protein
MPPSETVEFEREFEAIVRELRAVPSEPPPALRNRVRALGEPEPRRFRFPQLTWRGAGLVLVPACLLAVVAAAAIHGLLSSSKSSSRPVAERGVSAGAVQTVPRRSPDQAKPGATHTTANGRLDQGKDATSLGFAQRANGASGVPAPNPARHQDYQADLRVRVRDLDALGEKSADAMRITQDLGGYVASVTQSSTSGEPGEAYLVLRVPVGRVEDAMIRLSSLGTVLSQNVSIVDLENVVRRQRLRIQSLRIQIARITAALQQPGLAPDVKLRLQFQLDDARRSLADATGRNKATLRAAALSRISLALTTEKAVAAKHRSGRFGSAVSHALDFLAGAGAVALAAVIVLGPLAAIVLLLWWGVRTYRRREAQRLLGTT